MLGQDITGSTLTSRDTFGVAGLVRRASVLLAAAVTAITLNGNAVAAGDPDIVSYINDGVPILGIVGDLVNLPAAGSEINHDPVSGKSEALALNLGKAYNTVTVTFGALLAQEGPGELYREWGAWEAFDATGSPKGEGTFFGPQTEVTINAPGMQYLVFTARPYTLFADGTASPPDQDPGPDDGPNCSTGQACDSSDYYLLTLSAEGLSLPAPGATGADAWEDVNPAGFESTTPYLDGNGRFVDAPLVVNTAECAGDSDQNNTLGCTLQLSEKFKTVIKNSPDVNGAIEVNDVLTIEDTREGCGGVSPTSNVPLGLGLEEGGGPWVPAHLCGIPNDNGVPEIVLVDIDSTNFTTEYSVLEHEIDNTEIALAGFECRTGAEILNDTVGTLEERRSKLPVVAWLPKAEGEIPVKQGNIVIDTLQDITYGCGSYRGGTNRYSYFAYNLRHTVDANYRAIVRNALVQLSATIDQTSACVDSGKGSFAGIGPSMKTILAAYDSNRLPLAKQHLQNLLAKVESHKQLNERYRGCFYDLVNGAIVKGYPGDYPREMDSDVVPEVVPRNFRADLIVQTRHALYMFGRMLGVIDQNLPDDFKGLPPI